MSNDTDKQYEHGSSDLRVIDITAGLFLAAVSIALLFWFIPANVSHTVSQHDISADFFPTAAAWTLLGLSIALVADRVVKSTNLRKTMAASSGGIAMLLQLAVWLSVAALAYVGIVWLNFYATAFVLIIGGALACHYRKWRILLPVAIIAPVLIGQISWLIFSVKFN